MSEDVFGIDLGTTYSAIAHMDEYGRPQIIQNRDGQNTTPSVVYFESASNFVVGQEAKNGARVYPDETVSLIKREMGEKNERIFFDEPFYPETISSLILKQLVAEAQEATGSTSSRVVITVPAYFGLAEKEATRHAGQIAGLDVVGILAEPVAAALSTGITSAQDKCYFVYDLGGGTFDCTVLRTAQDTFEVVATDGNRKLGGADWDEALFDLVLSKFVQEKGIDDDPAADPEFYQGLMNDVESAKKTLSKKEKARLRCSYEGAQGVINVTREEFEAATSHLVAQTVEITRRVIETAQGKFPGLGIDRYLLVGGSSRMPMIRAALAEAGFDAENTDFDLSVAKGAAVFGQGEIPDPGFSGADGTAPSTAPGGASGAAPLPGVGPAKTVVTNVLSRGLGVGLVREDRAGDFEDYVEFLAHANETLPLTASLRGGIVADGQTSVEGALFEQGGEVESDAPGDNKAMISGPSTTIDGLPPMRANDPIDVTLEVSEEGVATLLVVEPGSGKSFKAEAAVSVLTQEDVKRAKKQIARIMTRS